jgi:putative intracellular protease/amidase
MRKPVRFILTTLLFNVVGLYAQTHHILLFVSHEQTYYSEYIVMYEALTTAGYTVDVRSASNDSASTYMLPIGTDIPATAASLPGGSYGQFTNQFQQLFGGTWTSAWNATPTYIPVNGRIQDVVTMANYDAMVIAGGTGAIDYRVDGNYNSQGVGPRFISAAEVQAAAEKLNSLALDALAAGKPVLAQCHGASLPVYWRIPGTMGPGEEALGYSLLKDHDATGYPDAQTPVYLSSLNVNHQPNDKVTVSSPHSSFTGNQTGAFKIITTQDWYPQTVAYAARTLLNILTTYPTLTQMQTNTSVLILHGGAIDSTNCSPANQANDIPCNYGGTPNFPADYTYIENLLNANSTNDPYSFTVSHVNLTGSLPYDPNNGTSILNYLNQYNVVVFFKHWSTGMNDSLQNAIVKYADQGGGVLGLHHGLYGHISGASNKNILINNLFGAESAAATWSGNLSNYNLLNTNYGHFVSTYGINYATPSLAPAVWNTNPPMASANNSFSYLPTFSIYDEIYNNMSFVAGESFGRNINDITPIFSNDYATAAQCHTAGFVKLFDGDLNGVVGKVAYYQAGERRESIHINHLYGQVIRNTVAWLAAAGLVPFGIENEVKHTLEIYPNPASDFVQFKLPFTPHAEVQIQIFTISGQLVLQTQPIPTENSLYLNIQDLPAGIYIVNAITGNTKFTGKLVK